MQKTLSRNLTLDELHRDYWVDSRGVPLICSFMFDGWLRRSGFLIEEIKKLYKSGKMRVTLTRDPNAEWYLEGLELQSSECEYLGTMLQYEAIVLIRKAFGRVRFSIEFEW